MRRCWFRYITGLFMGLLIGQRSEAGTRSWFTADCFLSAIEQNPKITKNTIVLIEFGGWAMGSS
jgi:hypothetical protein